jgi:type IV pilus assembly protein PilB
VDRLLEQLMREGLLTGDQARQVEAEQQSVGARIVTLVSRLGFIAEDELLRYFSRKYRIGIVNLADMDVSPDTMKLVSEELAVRYQVFPVRRIGNTLAVALSDPTHHVVVDDVQFATGLHVIPVLAGTTAIQEAIARHYGADGPVTALDSLLQVDSATGADAVELLEGRAQKVEITELGERAGEPPVIRFVNVILIDAIRKRASDIHFEPDERVFLVRYRIDGVLHDTAAPPKAMEAPVLSRLKIMAAMDIAERRLPQDGRFSVRADGREVDVRVSSLPTRLGEKVVLRLLDKSNALFDLDHLGFEGDDLEYFKKVIRAPYGMILVTGPTGSGKTTTLYSAISAINSPDINIVAAEDPIEYSLRRINQVQVREDIGLTFDALLRAFLRQDPDVLLVGEMRDSETAQIAVRAALTGHLVLSTLHTNDAASAVSRMINLGVAPSLVASSLLTVIAQRLCRKICPSCREVVEEAPISLLLDLGFRPEEVESIRTYRGRGCTSCVNTGYRGRTAIYEMLRMTPELQDATVRQCPASEIKSIAVKQGMRTLRRAVLRKVAQGITSVEEVLRVTFG